MLVANRCRWDTLYKNQSSQFLDVLRDVNRCTGHTLYFGLVKDFVEGDDSRSFVGTRSRHLSPGQLEGWLGNLGTSRDRRE